MFTNQQTKEIAIRWFEAFNQHNLDMLLTLYHEEAKHYSPKLKARHPETEGLIIGKPALRNWWQDAFERLPSLQYEIKKIIADDGMVFMEYLRHVDRESDLLVGEVLEIDNDLIVASRVFHG